MKEELRAAEEELAAAEAERDALLAQVPNPPDPSAPDGDTDEDAEELRRVGRARRPTGPEHTEIGRFEMERAARLSGSRFGYLVGDTALARARALPLRARPRRRARPHADAAAGARARGGDVRHRLLPDRAVEHLRARERRPLPHRHVRGRARRRSTWARSSSELPLRYAGVLDVLPPRVGRGRQGHARHVPRAPVQQGRAVRLLRARDVAATSTTGCSRSRRSSSRRSACRTASSTSPPATSARRRRRSTTSRRGSRRSSATARSRRRSNTTDFQARRLGIRYRVDGRGSRRRTR